MKERILETKEYTEDEIGLWSWWGFHRRKERWESVSIP